MPISSSTSAAALPPAKRRAALEVLTRGRLAELTEHYELEVPDRRVVKHHVDALIRARRVDFAELLAQLKRDELKAMCRVLDLDDAGREKQALIKRILSLGQSGEDALARASVGRERTVGSTAPTASVFQDATMPSSGHAQPKSFGSTQGRDATAKQPSPTQLTIELQESTRPPQQPLDILRSKHGKRGNAKLARIGLGIQDKHRYTADLFDRHPERLTLDQLESHLSAAANILRGSPVDRTDWKSYILPLLFFKRICDVWDEEYVEMLERYSEDFADEHRFQVPEDCHWNNVRGAARNVGQAIVGAMRGIERANQKHLYGIFGDAQWTNKERLPDELLKNLIEHFSALPLGNRMARSDIVGDAYEYLIKKFADATNKKAGEFYTPRSVVRLMVDILDPREGDTVYDPACGTGGMLLAAVEHVSVRGGDPRAFFGKLFGQEKNLTTSSVARMNLVLHGVEDFDIKRGDTLRNPVFLDSSTGGLATFDVVIANPPFSLANWGREVWESDPWGRGFAGLPTDNSGDFAWVQHMVKSMTPEHGRMAVVLPQGALFRGGIEGDIRQHLLKHDLIEAVIGLAPNLFYGTGLAACILVLRTRKPARRRRKVLIIDASSLFRKDRAQNLLEPEHAAEILGWFQKFEDVDERMRVVDLNEIEKEGWTLNISRYVLPVLNADIPPFDQAVAQFKTALARCREAEAALRREMKQGGWLS